MEPTDEMRAALRRQFKGNDNYAYEESFWRDWRAVEEVRAPSEIEAAAVAYVAAQKEWLDCDLTGGGLQASWERLRRAVTGE
jgi:hypothetical protein